MRKQEEPSILFSSPDKVDVYFRVILLFEKGDAKITDFAIQHETPSAILDSIEDRKGEQRKV